MSDPIKKLEIFDGENWITPSSMPPDVTVIDERAFKIVWDMLNDNTEVLWQQP